LLIQVPSSLYYTGFSTQWKNAGTVQNTGIEVALDWHDKMGSDFTYGANWNIAYNKNKVTKINSSLDYIEGGNDLILLRIQDYMARMQVGHPIGYFYGYKTAGVIQNAADLQNYINENCGGKAANSLQGTRLETWRLEVCRYQS
jgi:hypothetical protein